jgi:hypothetical protein
LIENGPGFYVAAGEFENKHVDPETATHKVERKFAIANLPRRKTGSHELPNIETSNLDEVDCNMA